MATIEAAIDFLSNQDWDGLLALFWLPLLFEFPRFVLGGAVAGWYFATRPAHRRAEHLVDAGVSVVVPAHNDAASVQKTARSLREQTQQPIQIIVVSDGSTDDTDAVCRRLLQQGLIDDYFEVVSRGGKSAAVNLALGAARHPFFLVTDSDTTFDRDAIATALPAFIAPEVGVVGGTLRVRNDKLTLATRVQQLNYAFSITLGRVVKNMLGFYFVASGAFGLYRTEAVRAIGGWDFGPGEDGDTMTRLRAAGWRAVFVPTAVAMTDVPVSFVRLARQRLRWNRSFVRNRWRKSRRYILNPFRATFDFPLALSFLDAYFFNAIVPFAFIVYLVQLFATYGDFAPIFVATVSLLYLLADLVQFGAALALSTRPRADIRLIAYLPLYSVVNAYFLRFVRLYALTNELLVRGSYKDAYVPEKVRRRIVRY